MTTPPASILDVTLDVEGRWRLRRAVGANASSLASIGLEGPRLGHEAAALAGGERIAPGAVVLRTTTPGVADHDHTVLRNALLAQRLHERTGVPILVSALDAPPSAQHLNVLHGSTDEAAADLVLGDDGLTWRGAPVRSLLNAAIVLELANRWGWSVTEVLDALPPDATVEGVDRTRVTLDLARQQQLATGSGFLPLEVIPCSSVAEVIDEAMALVVRHGRSHIAPNGVPGGVGTHAVLPPHRRHEIITDVRPALRRLDVAYGPGWARTTPLVAVEAPRSRPARHRAAPRTGPCACWCCPATAGWR